jgi:1-acyl-sn-glycerol-3-phosphate acyltransferase
MAKRELQWSPLGPWMYMSGAIFIDRGNSTKAQKSLEAAGEEMKREGISLMMYPEGTRHSDVCAYVAAFQERGIPFGRSSWSASDTRHLRELLENLSQRRFWYRNYQDPGSVGIFSLTNIFLI